MYKICKTAKAEQRQKQFQDTLLEMMKTQNFNSITIVSLCKELNVSRKTFYQYFDTLEDVLNAVLDKELKSGFLLLEEKLEVKKFFCYWKERKWLLDLLEMNELSHLLTIRSYENAFSSEEPLNFTITEMKYAGWIAMIISILIFWHKGKMKQSPEEMEQVLYGMINTNLSK